ncbi:MAG: DUF3991 and toprim domain-containing protein [Pirellulaceae bacterium]|nr:DUF3991 and toprim domain-containing protein [Pirellulaceae bacterium]
MNFDDLRRRADAARAVPLDAVLLARGAVRDPLDRHKWHSEQGPLSVTGPKFINWHDGQGGGGAIDLVMHLAGVDFRTALGWLEGHLAVGPPAGGQSATHAPGSQPLLPIRDRPGALRLPVPENRLLGRVRQYLTQRRGLAASLLDLLIQSGKLYADSRANAVFLLVAGKAQRPVGAELRGTGPRAWRGMAPGTHKDLGYFWIGAHGAREIVLCESAIDAMSCYQMHPHRICISTSGVRADPPWLDGLLARGYEVYCGFDADGPGDAAAARMIALYPTVRRLRPPSHDWNDVLTSHR